MRRTVLLGTAVLLAACGEDPIVGSWTSVIGASQVWIFDADGEYRTTTDKGPHGTWSRDDQYTLQLCPFTDCAQAQYLTVVQDGDEVFCIAATGHIREAMRELRRMDRPVKRVMIAGGGNIGLRLAFALEKDYSVRVIEHNKRRSEVLAARLTRALVLAGDVTDEELLEEESVAEEDRQGGGLRRGHGGCQRVLPFAPGASAPGGGGKASAPLPVPGLPAATGESG